MSKSSKGTVENLGKNVKAKSGLNKVILDQGWGEFRRQLEYKMRRNSGMLIAVPPQYTSQTCPQCSHTGKENRKDPMLACMVLSDQFFINSSSHGQFLLPFSNKLCCGGCLS